LEEVIPLIAIYAPSFLPSTCILPSQQARISEKKFQKSLAFALNYSPLFAQLKSKESPEGYLPIGAIRFDGAPTAISG
jgi:LETM1 and EF-hand domain-containing protein 1